MVMVIIKYRPIAVYDLMTSPIYHYNTGTWFGDKMREP